MNPYRIERPFRTAATVVAVLALLIGWFTTAASARAQEAGGGTTVAVVEVRGGDVIYSNAGTRCTVGFNARSGTNLYGLVTGRCARAATSWYADAALSVFIGTTAGVSFPGNDYALVRYSSSSVAFPGEVSLGTTGRAQDITGAANPAVGQSLCHVGRVTGYRCGTVTAVNVTVNYPEGVVSGLFRSNICSESGDAGGPAFSGGTALGVIVATTGNCASGGATYYQPVVEWLSVYGLSLY